MDATSPKQRRVMHTIPLPCALLSFIFSFFDFNYWVKNLRYVSKDFYNVRPSFTNLELFLCSRKSTMPPFEHDLTWITKFVNLLQVRCLRLNIEVPLIMSALPWIQGKVPQLDTLQLELYSNHEPNEQPNEAKEPKETKTKQLSLAECRIGACAKIRSLTIGGAGYYSNLKLDLEPELEFLKDLTSLTLKVCELNPSPQLHRLVNLVELDFARTNLLYAEFVLVAQTLVSLTKLGVPLVDCADERDLPWPGSRLRRLQSLTFPERVEDADDYREWLEPIWINLIQEASACLTSVTLERNDHCVADLMEALRTCINLKSLFYYIDPDALFLDAKSESTSDNESDSDGACAAEFESPGQDWFQQLTHLKLLSYFATNKWFLANFGGSKRLKSLSLRGCRQISEEVLSSDQEARFPDLDHARLYYGEYFPNETPKWRFYDAWTRALNCMYD